MKSPMRQTFEALHGFEVGDEMDIQTSVAWDNWKAAWRAGASHERESCAKVCDEIADYYGFDGGSVAEHCAISIRERSNARNERDASAAPLD